MYKPCSFAREEYLCDSDVFEAEDITPNEYDKELSEFNDNAGDLAVELAYTRYALAKAELTIGTMEKDSIPCRLMEIDFQEGWAKFHVPNTVIGNGFHAGTAGINFSGVQG